MKGSYALHREEQPKCMEFCCGLCDGREQREANTVNIVVSICYRSPGQEDKTDEAFSH